MAAKALTAEQLEDVLNVVAHHGTVSDAARALGMSRGTLDARWQQMKRSLTCACGAEMTLRSTRCRRCTGKLAQARYRRTEKGKAAQRRYATSAGGRVAHARYVASERGRRATDTLNGRRIFIGDTYQGRAKTPEIAAVIRSHIKERVREFISRQPTGA